MHRLVAIAMSAAILAACDRTPTVCAGIGIALVSTTDTVLAVGQSYVAGAGEGGSCDGGATVRWDPHLFRWASHDSLIVAATPIDSMHARVTGLRQGSTTVNVFMDTSSTPYRITKVTVR